MRVVTSLAIFVLTFLFLISCKPASSSSSQNPTIKVIAVETFLGDVTQNITGDQIKVENLIPVGLDPHAFEPTPQDVTRIASSQVLIVNGAGFEEWLQKILDNAGGKRLVIEASAGLTSRTPRQGEGVIAGNDPHFWLDPNNVIKYVENIRNGMIQADPEGKSTYTSNADAYIAKLKELDTWIQEQVKQVPPERRLLVTNHESFGYFADRYGFKIIGTIVPSISTGASPSAQQLAHLIDQIKTAQVTAIFLETGTNPQLADQVARETGVKVVTELYSHSITSADGKAPSYIDMMKYNTFMIVSALK
ncbi:MAG: metal ABC transporter substrate-binding protein [Anaerolineales bacterium]|nr:metal ABC transporter substrate-binding protein [Anaerolineales bacterium]